MPPLPLRTRNAAATRASILDAARQRFLRESYDGVGLRDVAGDAGVDVALVSRYFGGKEGLFKEVLGNGKADKFRDLAGVPSLAVALSDLAMQADAPGHRAHAEQLIIILRSASSPTASSIVREVFSEDVLAPMAALITGPDAELRASLVMAILMGTTVLQSIMSVGALCNRGCEPTRGRLQSVIEAALRA